MWYKDAVIYELHVRSFYDANGDGIGDFQGLTQKLDYLCDLGITALWLLPFYPSPLRDDGYDIADYTAIHPHYGTLADFDAFIEAAHQRGLKVITELVVNHTSVDHPWFQASRRAKPGDPHYDTYVWSKDNTNYKDARIIFKDFESSNWQFDPVRQEYYWHRFFAHQPDLNFENEQVQKALFDVVDFWLKRGVDGLRLDAVPYLFEAEHSSCENLPATHAFLKKLRLHVDTHFDGRMLLAEANQWPKEAAAYFGEGDGDECHMGFHFPLMPKLFLALAEGTRHALDSAFEATPPIPKTAQWATFLRNHDELTLEMVTEEERILMLETFASHPRSAINLGIRHRLAPLLRNDRRKIELLFTLLLTLPGTPVLYYGDELGMGDDVFLGDRDGLRTPMQWSSALNAGFSKADPQRLFLPPITKTPYHYSACNVDAAQKDPNSLFARVQQLIHHRKSRPSLSRGDFKQLQSDNEAVFAFKRQLNADSEIVIANLSNHNQRVSVEDCETLTLAPFACVCLSTTAHEDDTDGPIHSFLVAADQRRIERCLPAFLQHKRWFKGRRHTITRTQIHDIIFEEGAETRSAALIVDVSFHNHKKERYAVYAGLKDGRICDIFEDESLLNAFFDAAFSRRLRSQQKAELAFEGSVISSERAKHNQTEQSNSSATLNDAYYLKAFRRLEDGIHPEVELNHHLSALSFKHAPQFLGSLNYKGEGGQVSLAVLTKHLKSEDSALDFVLKNGGLLQLADLTGHMHLALAAPFKPGFGCEPITPFYCDSLRQSIFATFDKAVRALDKQPPADCTELAFALKDARPQFVRMIQETFQKPIASPRIRVHGDYHLGQILVSSEGPQVVDFEGDPLKPLAERRLKRSALYDVASMIRSFDYAQKLHRLAPEWAHQAESEFVAAYFREFKGAPFLKDDYTKAREWLEVLVLEKALREVLYEVHFRPDFVHIPLKGLLSRLRPQL